MFCTSDSATALGRKNLEHSSPATIRLGSASARAIDRHNPIIHASRRRSLSSSTSTHQNLKDGRKSTSSLLTDKTNNGTNAAGASERRKSSASLVDAVRNRSGCIKPSAYFSPPPLRPHLQKSQSQKVQNCHKPQPHFLGRELAIVQAGDKKATDPKTDGEKLVKCLSLKNEAPLFKVPSSDKNYYFSPFRVNSDQVVVVRVSLHCKGCAGKVKKYISRMKGVTFFNVDFDAKKVIVVGDITPLEVLASISKVRTAQLLPPEKPNSPLASQTNDTKPVIGELAKM